MASTTTESALPPGLHDALVAILGPANVIVEPAGQAAYLHEWRGLWTGRTAAVLRPGSTEEVSRLLALAHASGTPVVPQGGNTGLVGGQIPFEAGRELVLSLGRLDRVRAVDAEGYCLTAEAGVTLQRVQEAAAAADRLFPLSLASQGTCQIGGNLSTNAGGVAVLAYGNARDMVLGLEVVLADGQIWNGLRALRKDNTGYDLKSLFIGAEGTLGVITAATLKLFPRPREVVTAFAGLASLEAVRDLFLAMRDGAGPALTAFEVMPRLALEFVLRHAPRHRDPLAGVHPWYVLLELSGASRDGVTAGLAERLLGRAIEAGTVLDAAVAASEQQSRELWSIRETLPEMQKLEGGSIKHDVSVPIARIPELIERGNARLAQIMPGVRPLPFGHFGDGNIHYNVSQPPGMDSAAFLARWWDISDVVYGLVVELGGSISAEHGVGRLKREQLVKVKSPLEIDLMRRLKQAFDPKGILNPGKVL